MQCSQVRLNCSLGGSIGQLANRAVQGTVRVRKTLCVLVALWFALAACAAPTPALADIPAGDHVYLYTSGDAVDVTSTYYNSNGQDYVVYGSPIAVTLNYQDEHVYDLNGSIIGFITVPAPPLSAGLDTSPALVTR